MNLIKRLTTTALAVLALAAPGAHAQNDWVNLTVDDGLPANEIQFVEGDAAGNIWVGTLKGLVQFNDMKFSEPVVKTSVFDVLSLDEQHLLVGTNRGAMIVKDGAVVEEMLKGNYVAPMIRVADDRVWALKRKGGQDAEINVLIEMVGDDWKKMVKDADKSPEWKEVKALADRSVVDIRRTDDGRVWVQLDGDGVAEFNPKQGFDEFKHHLEGLNVTALHLDQKKQVWAGLWGAGVTVLRDGRWHDHLRKQEAYVFDIVEDNAGGLWVSTNRAGLFRYDGAKWDQQLGDEGAVSILEKLSDGTLIISVNRWGGLHHWAGDDKWKPYFDSPLPIRCIYEAKDGTVFAGGVLDGLHVLPVKE